MIQSTNIGKIIVKFENKTVEIWFYIDKKVYNNSLTINLLIINLTINLTINN